MLIDNTEELDSRRVRVRAKASLDRDRDRDGDRVVLFDLTAGKGTEQFREM